MDPKELPVTNMDELPEDGTDVETQQPDGSTLGTGAEESTSQVEQPEGSIPEPSCSDYTSQVWQTVILLNRWDGSRALPLVRSQVEGSNRRTREAEVSSSIGRSVTSLLYHHRKGQACAIKYTVRWKYHLLLESWAKLWYYFHIHRGSTSRIRHLPKYEMKRK